jgi:macrolide transport system ATP-binding/permease protein
MPEWKPEILRRLALLKLSPTREAEIAEELAQHLDDRYQELLAAGNSADSAFRATLDELKGDDFLARSLLPVERDLYREPIAPGKHSSNFFSSIFQDIRYAMRVLRKSSSFTVVAVLTLALGIGANTLIFSFIDAVLLRSLPVQDPQQLVVFRWTAHAKPKIHGQSSYGDCDTHSPPGDCSFSVPFFKTIRAEGNTFSGVAAFAGPIDVDLSGNGAASIADGTYVSGDFFSTLGVRTFVGRPLILSDDTPSAPPAIVLNYAYWVRAFGADRSAVGRTVRLDNTAATIVGVADPHFTNLTPGKTQDFFMPLSLSNRVREEWGGKQDYLTDASNWWVVMIGRLKHGVSAGEAQAAATTIYHNEMLHGATPVFNEAAAPAIQLLPACPGLNGETSRIVPMLVLMMIVVGFVLLIACANVAGLTLARSAARQKEMAVRLALGAGRARLIRQLLTESVLLAVAGGAFGVFLSVWRIGAVVGMVSGGSDEPFPFVVVPDWRVLTFTVAATFTTAILFGLVPALRGSRIDLTPSLKESAPSLPGGAAYTGRMFRLGDALVIAQVALSIVVLIGAGLLVRTLRNLHSINPGFDTRNILLFGIDPTIAGYTDAQTQQLYGNLQQRFAALPGVISVSYSEEALLAGGWSGAEVHLDDAPPKQDVDTKQLPVGLNFFSTMRIPILAGRAFNSADFAAAVATNAAADALRSATRMANPASSPASISAPPSPAREAYDHSAPVPVIINEAFAKKYLPNKNPIGMHVGGAQTTDNEVQHPGPGYTIVGIASNTKYDQLKGEIEPILFLPVVRNSAHFELRTAASPTELVRSVREIVSQAGDNLPLTQVRTQTEQIDHMLFQQRMLARLSGFFGLAALVLACIGLYGLLSYEVARRTRELGIRVALGAHQSDLLRLVVGQGIVLVLIGAAIGIAAAIGITRFMSTMLYGVHADDPLTFAGVAILLTLVALAACYIPARRAMRADPMVALRYE